MRPQPFFLLNLSNLQRIVVFKHLFPNFFWSNPGGTMIPIQDDTATNKSPMFDAWAIYSSLAGPSTASTKRENLVPRLVAAKPYDLIHWVDCSEASRSSHELRKEIQINTHMNNMASMILSPILFAYLLFIMTNLLFSHCQAQGLHFPDFIQDWSDSKLDTNTSTGTVAIMRWQTHTHTHAHTYIHPHTPYPLRLSYPFIGYMTFKSYVLEFCSQLSQESCS